MNQCLGRLLQKRQLDDAASDDFQAARSMLETLPLSTDEFGVARTRLQYARQYLRHGSRSGRPSHPVIVRPGPGRERHFGSVLLPLREQFLQRFVECAMRMRTA